MLSCNLKFFEKLWEMLPVQNILEMQWIPISQALWTVWDCAFSDQIVTGRSSGTVIPPPLVRGGQQVSSKHGSQIIMPPLVRGAQVSHRCMLLTLLLTCYGTDSQYSCLDSCPANISLVFGWGYWWHVVFLHFFFNSASHGCWGLFCNILS